jgi:hypothetical protein
MAIAVDMHVSSLGPELVGVIALADPMSIAPAALAVPNRSRHQGKLLVASTSSLPNASRRAIGQERLTHDGKWCIVGLFSRHGKLLGRS